MSAPRSRSEHTFGLKNSYKSRRRGDPQAATDRNSVEFIRVSREEENALLLGIDDLGLVDERAPRRVEEVIFAQEMVDRPGREVVVREHEGSSNTDLQLRGPLASGGGERDGDGNGDEDEYEEMLEDGALHQSQRSRSSSLSQSYATGITQGGRMRASNRGPKSEILPARQRHNIGAGAGDRGVEKLPESRNPRITLSKADSRGEPNAPLLLYYPEDQQQTQQALDNRLHVQLITDMAHLRARSLSGGNPVNGAAAIIKKRSVKQSLNTYYGDPAITSGRDVGIKRNTPYDHRSWFSF